MSERAELEARLKSIERELDSVRAQLDARHKSQGRELEALMLEISDLEDRGKALDAELARVSTEHAIEADREAELTEVARRAKAHVVDLLARRKKR